MLSVVLFFTEITILFFLSNNVQKKLFRFLFRKVGKKDFSIYLLSLLFLPGTFVHEMSHFLVALFLFVPVGNVHFMPKIGNKSVELGSVSIAKVDFFRRFLISMAPLFLGTTLILLAVFLISNQPFFTNLWWRLLALYLIFTIANTMFISKKDSEGIWGFLILITLTAIIVVLLGLNIDYLFDVIKESEKILRTASLYLSLPILLDLFVATLLRRY